MLECSWPCPTRSGAGAVADVCVAGRVSAFEQAQPIMTVCWKTLCHAQYPQYAGSRSGWRPQPRTRARFQGRRAHWRSRRHGTRRRSQDTRRHQLTRQSSDPRRVRPAGWPEDTGRSQCAGRQQRPGSSRRQGQQPRARQAWAQPDGRREAVRLVALRLKCRVIPSLASYRLNPPAVVSPNQSDQNIEPKSQRIDLRSTC